MSHDTNMLRAKLRSALDKVGKNNGHACPTTQNNSDPILHELFVASEASSYFKQRFDAAKAEAMQLAGDDIETIVQSVIDTMTGTSAVLAEGDLYALTADIKKPAKRLNQTALRNYLQTALGLTKEDIDKAFEASSTYSAPAKTIKVASR